VRRPAGSALTVLVRGPAGGRWSWRSDGEQWWPSDQDHDGTTTIVIGTDLLWRLCVRMVEPQEAQRRATVTGDHAVAAAALDIVSITR
jgi:hypothetical protein